jgi:hypothetical protein
MVPGMDERPSQYHVTITVARRGGRVADPARFAAAADRAAWRRSASIVTAYTADQVITVVTVQAPGRHAAEAVARAVIADALQHQPPHLASTRAKPVAARPCREHRPPEPAGPVAPPARTSQRDASCRRSG